MKKDKLTVRDIFTMDQATFLSTFFTEEGLEKNHKTLKEFMKKVPLEDRIYALEYLTAFSDEEFRKLILKAGYWDFIYFINPFPEFQKNRCMYLSVSMEMVYVGKHGVSAYLNNIVLPILKNLDTYPAKDVMGYLYSSNRKGINENLPNHLGGALQDQVLNIAQYMKYLDAEAPYGVDFLDSLQKAVPDLVSQSIEYIRDSSKAVDAEVFTRTQEAMEPVQKEISKTLYSKTGVFEVPNLSFVGVNLNEDEEMVQELKEEVSNKLSEIFGKKKFSISEENTEEEEKSDIPVTKNGNTLQ